MVDSVHEWPWSSYRATIGEEAKPAWLETDWILGRLASGKAQAIRAYIDFVRSGIGLPSIWDNLESQIYLGSEAFVTRLKSRLSGSDDLSEVPRRQRRPSAKPLDEYQRLAAADYNAMAQAYLSGDYSMKEIAQFFQVHYATVSRAVRRYEQEMS